MAARTKADEPEQPAATVRTQEYAAGQGWQVGDRAPSDAFRALDAAGTGEPVGPVVYSHPGDYARQIVAKGGEITKGVRAELDAAEADSDSEQG
ncbi:hypothetical protein [Streptomyces sp. MI02-7b]|uniref:hypothetical protein n=1 Tax=Streptomyces sp. MI02-7b TaxID=462941 RepID=UPI0029B76B5A|nr:hypothetical protein [Streptomyces sp. MI02-7b]MDX3074617.1 hypothetical protein [Streptomyces sp. MI02-7b]